MDSKILALISIWLPIALLGYFDLKAPDQPLPGRKGSDSPYYIELGKTRVFFYMSDGKELAAKKLIDSINNSNIQITMDVTSPPCPVSEISAVATKYANPTDYELNGQICMDEMNRGVYPDPVGQEVLNEYARSVRYYAEQTFNIKLTGLSRELSLNANQDALKLHQDRFYRQYEYLSNLPLPIDKHILFQDLTLVDWTMAKGTFSATMMQDGDDGDRLLMILFPGEVVGMAHTEPMVYKGPYHKPEYPGAITFPFHTAVAPTNYIGESSVGSWKGKRISTSTRGVIPESEYIKTLDIAKKMHLNRKRLIKAKQRGVDKYRYDNGVMVLSGHLPVNELSLEYSEYIGDPENVSIYEIISDIAYKEAKKVQSLFRIEGEPIKILHFIKRDSGFSSFEKMGLVNDTDQTFVLINRSDLPKGYKHYTISEDTTKQNFPWIHMYQFPLGSAMQIDGNLLRSMAISPIEEILYRDELDDADLHDESILNNRIVHKLDVYIFSKEQ